MKSLKIVLLLCFLLFVFLLPLSEASANQTNAPFSAQFKLLNHTLSISIQPSLYVFYSNMTHKISQDSDYAKLVTPHAVEPIAANIKNLTANLPNSDEQFANAVLSLVHQIPYNITGAKYPIETINNNAGDCVGLSLLAASIMKAGGLDVVLIHYTGIDPGHLNVGVYLPYTPLYHSLLMTPTFFNYDNKTYWTAEATGKMDWNVGEQADSLATAQASIIPLDETEASFSGQVSATLDAPLLSSSISLNLLEQPLDNQNDTRAFILSGAISPAQAEQNVTLYVYYKGVLCDILTNSTNDIGRYKVFWDFNRTGTYFVMASWSGNSKYAGADSETLVVLVGPQLLFQFQAAYYNYIFGHAGAGVYELRPFIGVNDFLSITLGANVTFSYAFSIVPTGHEASNVETQTVTVPASEHTIITRHGQVETLTIPERTRLVPTNVPRGLEALSLPDDFNQTINNHFCVILQNNPADNYSLSLKGLNSYDVEDMQDSDGNTNIVNATEELKENIWYRFSSVISLNRVITKIEDENGTLIHGNTAHYNSTGGNQIAILIANSIDNAIVFKDLKIQPLGALPQTTEPPMPPSNSGNRKISLYPALVLLLACIAFAVATVLYVKKRSNNA